MTWTDFFKNVMTNLQAPITSGAFWVNTTLPFAPWVSAAYNQSVGYTPAQYSGSGTNTNTTLGGTTAQKIASGLAFGSTSALLLAGFVAYQILKKGRR